MQEIFSKAQNIQKVFVLMMGNHSFDHLLGFSNITGIDSETGNETSIDRLKGKEFNIYEGVQYFVRVGAVEEFLPKYSLSESLKYLSVILKYFLQIDLL